MEQFTEQALALHLNPFNAAAAAYERAMLTGDLSQNAAEAAYKARRKELQSYLDSFQNDKAVCYALPEPTPGCIGPCRGWVNRVDRNLAELKQQAGQVCQTATA